MKIGNGRQAQHAQQLKIKSKRKVDNERMERATAGRQILYMNNR